MKKLLATVLAVVLAMTMVLGTALADEKEIGTENGDYTEAINAAPEGSKIVITAEFTGEEVKNWETMETGPVDTSSWTVGWGVGGMCPAGDWTVDGEFQYNIEAIPQIGDKITAEFNLDDVKKEATGAIQVNFYNGFAVRKVVIVSPAAADGDGKGGEGQGDAQGDGKGADTPKTADTMTVVLFAGVAILALGAVVASKKARA